MSGMVQQEKESGEVQGREPSGSGAVVRGKESSPQWYANHYSAGRPNPLVRLARLAPRAFRMLKPSACTDILGDWREQNMGSSWWEGFGKALYR